MGANFYTQYFLILRTINVGGYIMINLSLLISECTSPLLRSQVRLSGSYFVFFVWCHHRSRHCFYFRDSRHSINASPDAIKKPGTLIHIGKIILLMTTSQPKSNRRRCIKAISENTIIAIVVKGLMIRSLLSQNVVNIAYLLLVLLCSFKKYITGADNRKKCVLIYLPTYLFTMKQWKTFNSHGILYFCGYTNSKGVVHLY